MTTVTSKLDQATRSAWHNEDGFPVPASGVGVVVDYEFHPSLNLARHAGPMQYVKTRELPHAVEFLAGARIQSVPA